MSKKFPKHKHEIKEDKFVTFVFQSADYLKENWKKFAIGGVAVIVIILAIITFTSQHHSLTKEALQQFSKAMNLYNDQDFLKAESKFKEISIQYGSTKYGQYALLYLGKIAVSKDSVDYDVAMDYFEKASKIKNKMYKQAALLGEAKCYLANGNEDEYYTRLRKIIREFSNFYKTPNYIFEIAEYYYNNGEKDKALVYYNQIVDGFKKSNLYNKAKTKSDAIKTENFVL
ncbi:MAG: tetratricopeptide repeat protein [Candidatus Cloacimonadota bacterium]|nr:tetratricopeptide repeat protein [Candidatus Cloacimonadota bacterium]